MNKRFARFLIFSLLIFSVIPCWAQSQYFTGDGGKGKSITILPPRGANLAKDQAYLPDLVANELVSNFRSFSAMTLFDRVSNQKQYDELLSGVYDDNDKAGLDLGHLASTEYMLVGDITKTSTGYTLHLTVNRNDDKTTAAAYSGTVSIAELDNLVGVRKASLDLLPKMGVRLTAQAQAELTKAPTSDQVNALTTMAQGITAQRQGTEVAALSYYFQAAAFDPALAEAVSRSSILAANISSGNIGMDARNDIQWRKNWIARLEETEKWFNSYFDTYFKTLPPMPYTLFYTSDIEQIGEIDYKNETVTLGGIAIRLRPSREWAQSAELPLQSVQKSVQAVYDGLNATGRKTVWGLDKWPQQGSFNWSPFGKQAKTFTVVVELVNSRNKVIGRQTIQTGGSYEIPVPLPGNGTRIQISADEWKTVNFANVKADDITDSLTVRIASVNGTPSETAVKNGVLQIQAWQDVIEMVQVPGGSFQIGKELGTAGGSDVTPIHTVTLTGFKMGKYPITQAQYWVVMGTNPSRFTASLDCPVENVTWYDAVEFCNKLSVKEGLQPVYTISGRTPAAGYPITNATVTADWGKNGYRLPTEAEWEYAAKGGNPGAAGWVGYTYSGSNNADDVAWYVGNSGGRTHEVGQKRPNRLGLYDMSGNVLEWCWDWNADYPSGAQTNPVGASSGFYRVRRGGSWDYSAGNTRSACRFSDYPNYRYSDIGFRLVRP